MKKVLFLIPNLAHGGAEKVLVNLVNNLDKTKYEVFVQTLFDTGINKQYLNKEVKYIPGYKKTVRGNSHIMKLFSPKGCIRTSLKTTMILLFHILKGLPQE